MHAPVPASPTTTAAFNILAAVSLCHLLNDMVQSLLPSIYPILKVSFHLNFGQIGLISFVYQVVASLLQPFIGLYTDRKPMPYALAVGMGFTLLGIALLATAPTFSLLLVASAVVGIGSAIFHPESSRIARIASGGQHGFAQSFFQVGGNTGSAIGPLLAALIVLPEGQHGVAWFSIAAVLGILVLILVGRWRSHHLARATPSHLHLSRGARLPRRAVVKAVAVLAALIFSKYFYLASMVGISRFISSLDFTFPCAVRSCIFLSSWSRLPREPSLAGPSATA
jgi:FSR family fosmidomycin resistance protein-like MFS transporter